VLVLVIVKEVICMGINGQKSLYNQLIESLEKIDELVSKTNSLVDELKEKERKILELTNLNEKLQLEIKRLKTKNKKDSSNSSRPSGTNGYKKVITNRREPSNKKQGGQIGHELHKLDEAKIEELINKDLSQNNLIFL